MFLEIVNDNHQLFFLEIWTDSKFIKTDPDCKNIFVSKQVKRISIKNKNTKKTKTTSNLRLLLRLSWKLD